MTRASQSCDTTHKHACAKSTRPVWIEPRSEPHPRQLTQACSLMQEEHRINDAINSSKVVSKITQLTLANIFHKTAWEIILSSSSQSRHKYVSFCLPSQANIVYCTCTIRTLLSESHSCFSDGLFFQERITKFISQLSYRNCGNIVFATVVIFWDSSTWKWQTAKTLLMNSEI